MVWCFVKHKDNFALPLPHMEHSPWETNGRSSGQKVPRLLWTLKVQYCIHKILTLVPNSEPDESSPHPLVQF
jgi:hypothetical protein